MMWVALYSIHIITCASTCRLNTIRSNGPRAELEVRLMHQGYEGMLRDAEHHAERETLKGKTAVAELAKPR